jgi:hypothetical protein
MSVDKDLLLFLGELRGEMRGMREQLETNQQTTNQRIDDMRNSIEGQLKGHGERITTLEEDGKNMIWKVTSMGSAAGAVGAMVAEVAKHFIGK